MDGKEYFRDMDYVKTFGVKVGKMRFIIYIFRQREILEWLNGIEERADHEVC